MIFKDYSQFSQSRQAEQSRCRLVTLPLYQWGHRCLAEQFLPRSPGSGSQAGSTLLSTVYHTHCPLCLVQSSKPLWEEAASTCKEAGVASGRETCCRSHSQRAPQLGSQPRSESSRGGATAWDRLTARLSPNRNTRNLPPADSMWVTVYNRR